MDAHAAFVLAQAIVDYVNALADPIRLALMSTPAWHAILYVLNVLADFAGVVDIVFEDGSIILEF